MAQHEDIRIEPFDGRNWEAHGASLAHLSQDPVPNLEDAI